MTLPNHLAGGLVFTGFFAALANINILESPATIGAVLLGATLPDIDHPRSPIGRLFLPLSRYLNSRHGHRTLTHSLLGLGIFWLAAGLLEQTLWQSQAPTEVADPARSPAPATTLEAQEVEAVRQAVEAAGGNISLAARRLGVARNTVYRKLAIATRD